MLLPRPFRPTEIASPVWETMRSICRLQHCHCAGSANHHTSYRHTRASYRGPLVCLSEFHCFGPPDRLKKQQNPQALQAQWLLFIQPGLTFNNSTFCPHSCICVFCMDFRTNSEISLYNINWPVCITETQCVYCAVRTGSLYTASLTFSNSTFYPHSVFMCFVWI